MITKKECVFETETDFSDFNEHNVFKPYAYQKYFSQAGEWDCVRHNCNVSEILKYNMSWAIVSMAVEIVKPMDRTMKLQANTWYSQRQGAFFRREFVFTNENDEVMFQGYVVSVLFDLLNRNIYRGIDLPFEMIDPFEEYTIPECPRKKPDLEFTEVDERKVYNSHIDVLGHVSNGRYGEFAYDTLSDEERDNLSQIKRMDISFKSELRVKDTFTMLKAFEGDKIMMQGYNNTKSDLSFNVIYTF